MKNTETVTALWQHSVEMFSHRTALYFPREEFEYFGERELTSLSYQQAEEQVINIGEGLAYIGLKEEDHCLIICERNSRLPLTELAVLGNRAVAIPVNPHYSPHEMEQVFTLVAPRIVFVENRDLLEKYKNHITSAATVKAVVVMSEDYIAVDEYDEKTTFAFEHLLQIGFESRIFRIFRGRRKKSSPDDTAHIFITQNSEGMLQDVPLSQGQIARTIGKTKEIHHPGSDTIHLSLLPPWHCLDHTINYVLLSAGAALVCLWEEKYWRLIAHIEPTSIAALPAQWVQLYKKCVEIWERKKHFGLCKGIYRFCEKGIQNQGHTRETPHPLIHSIGRLLFHGPLRSKGGKNLRTAYIGASPAPWYVLTLLEMLHVQTYSIYSRTHAASILSLGKARPRSPAYCGTLLGDTEVRIDKESERHSFGEIHLRSPRISTDPTYWHHTGDMGTIEGNQLSVHGASKSEIILRGRSLFPEWIELIMDRSEFVERSALFSHGENLYACIAPNVEALQRVLPRKKEYDLEEILRSTVARKIILNEINTLLEDARNPHVVHDIYLIPEISCAKGLLLHTYRINRSALARVVRTLNLP
ncbi:AMP-binding protein [Chitinivibrio alkaliphilus]|uniref:AMP-dependent synthetase and ligase n=1 Tax=Chitinivibrio alkaliphilus ACht1 TaxID=1313304 RepID=U7D795_9BACT|nr:AMP-binding protein [Chitinivibrio alkaliphilus]ERP31813.1 AMP-dependent synthetase and ligase [Chitinivibrio alkaliphilus ACht1]